jgi:hypothetical protein
MRIKSSPAPSLGEIWRFTPAGSPGIGGGGGEFDLFIHFLKDLLGGFRFYRTLGQMVRLATFYDLDSNTLMLYQNLGGQE